MKKPKKEHKKSYITAKLILYDWGWRDNIIYRLKAKAGEKGKGLMMLEKIKDLFNITRKDEEAYIKSVIEMQTVAIPERPKEDIKWTRDPKGNIISPFSKRTKEVKED